MTITCDICPYKKECDALTEDYMYNPDLYEGDYDFCLYEIKLMEDEHESI